MMAIEKDPTNIKLIYEYTQSVLEAVNDSITRLNNKFSTVIGFSGILLRFSIDLPDSNLLLNQWSCISCSISKILVCVLSIISICYSAWGLTSERGGDIVPPSLLLYDEDLKDWYHKTDEECRAFIALTWCNGILELTNIRKKKATILNFSIWTLTSATIVFGISIILPTIVNLLP